MFMYFIILVIGELILRELEMEISLSSSYKKFSELEVNILRTFYSVYFEDNMFFGKNFEIEKMIFFVGNEVIFCLVVFIKILKERFFFVLIFYVNGGFVKKILNERFFFVLIFYIREGGGG